MIFQGTRNRIAFKLGLIKLRTLGLVKGLPYASSHSWGKLLFTGDGDAQEIQYHVKGESWYKKEHNLLSPYISSGDAVIDVGANLGFMALLFSRLVGAEGKVLAFEPSGRTFDKLEKNIRENNLSNVTCFNLGCGSQPTTSELYNVSGFSGHNSLSKPTAESSDVQAESIQVVRLDDHAENIGKIGFIKIDTEGYESEVLLGATEILKSKRPVVYLELGMDYGESSKKSIKILKEHEYTFLEEPDLSKVHKGANFLAIPNEKFEKATSIKK